MNIKHVMKEYYTREMQHHHAPDDMPEILASIIPEKITRRASSLCLTIAFNSAAAVLIMLQVFIFADYKTPMADVLKAIDEKYDIGAAIYQGVNSLQELLKHYKNYKDGGSQ